MMKKTLYISNIEVPYRSEFFNQLAKKVDLTVLYERKKSSNRDVKWTNSVDSQYNIKYLKGIKIKNEYSFDLRILKYVFSRKYNSIIIGCYNSPSQMMLIFFMKLFHRKYILNFDGEIFASKKGLKNRLKLFFIRGASKYLIAGDEAKKNLAKYVDSNKIYSYYFSSLNKKEIIYNAKKINQNNDNSIIVVGQYFNYKGLDVALEVAKLDDNIKYKFIGSGVRSNLLKEKINKMHLSNVEVIPFLEKKYLYDQYCNCKALLLPTNQECWGLVINEAASVGCPIVSTYGSGAAVEFLKGKYSCFLAHPGDIKEIYNCLCNLDNCDINKYKKYLIEKSNKYYIEQNVDVVSDVINGVR